ncbi:MAG TPA: hypothetical protein VMK32_11770 [Burkholderiaceae bacterium]|nr:hypothetical protein [Burkholderiaceae bacterium]
MRDRDTKGRAAPPGGSRSGPRARAFQERSYGDPYQRAERPDRRGPPRERLQAPASIRLDPDVARVFRDSESVNVALRLVIRLARLGSGRPSGPPRDRGAPFRDRGAGARARPDERPARKPRFEEG